MKRLWILVMVVAIGALAGVLGAVAAHKPDKVRVVDACHAAILKVPGATGRFFNEQVAVPSKGSYVVTGLLGTTGQGQQWSCSATIAHGQVKLTGAEFRAGQGSR